MTEEPEGHADFLRHWGAQLMDPERGARYAAIADELDRVTERVARQAVDLQQARDALALVSGGAEAVSRQLAVVREEARWWEQRYARLERAVRTVLEGYVRYQQGMPAREEDVLAQHAMAQQVGYTLGGPREGGVPSDGPGAGE